MSRGYIGYSYSLLERTAQKLVGSRSARLPQSLIPPRWVLNIKCFEPKTSNFSSFQNYFLIGILAGLINEAERIRVNDPASAQYFDDRCEV